MAERDNGHDPAIGRYYLLQLVRVTCAAVVLIGGMVMTGKIGAPEWLGALALVVWLVFLVSPEDTPSGDPLVGVVALGLWWAVAIAGLMILVRWLPSKGRHAVAAAEDTWSSGPGLSLLAHLGMVVGVAVFTWAYWTAAV